MTEKPVHPQIVIATMTYSACDGDARKGCDGMPDGVEGRVDQTVVTVGQPQEDDALRDGRDRHRDVRGCAVDRDEPHRPVHRRGDEQSDQHRAGNEQRGVDDGVLDRLDEHRVVGQLAVVVEADPRGLRRQQVGLLERQLQRHEHRQQTEDADQHHRRTHQRPPRHVSRCGRPVAGSVGTPTSRPALRRRPGRRRSGRLRAAPCRASPTRSPAPAPRRSRGTVRPVGRTFFTLVRFSTKVAVPGTFSLSLSSTALS